MKTVTLIICPTFQAQRDKIILENNGIRAVVVPHFTSPQAYVGDSQTSEIIVRDDELEQAKELLGIE
ncbi:MAG: hypothetical protein B6I38_05140 [Anaerolineaceae bacterium 4572_5.1]|nr:MAG: hypothetical protein B6I38_05140 [Anaerolineaceae bacterium 4572_5.1]